MDLSYTPEYQAFRDEVRRFLDAEWPKRPAGERPDAAAIAAFRRKAVAAGYLYRNILRQYGGSEQSPDVLKAQIIQEEFERRRAPANLSGNGMAMLVPTLLELGTPEQKEMFVAKTVSGEYQWAQGYSEPGSGSDLASVRTRAELVNGQWVINGQKVWSTRAHQSQYMFALVKTEPDAPKHESLSYILLDLRQPGVTVRPLKQMTGGADFCEVFFTDAVAPVEWTVGKRGEGWSVSRSTLKHERSYIGGADRAQATFDRLFALAKAHLADCHMQAARDAVEAHGGIGYTWEADVHIWFKRAMFNVVWAGSPTVLRERYAVLQGW